MKAVYFFISLAMMTCFSFISASETSGAGAKNRVHLAGKKGSEFSHFPYAAASTPFQLMWGAGWQLYTMNCKFCSVFASEINLLLLRLPLLLTGSKSKFEAKVELDVVFINNFPAGLDFGWIANKLLSNDTAKFHFYFHESSKFLYLNYLNSDLFRPFSAHAKKIK